LGKWTLSGTAARAAPQFSLVAGGDIAASPSQAFHRLNPLFWPSRPGFELPSQPVSSCRLAIPAESDQNRMPQLLKF
jgi:hypothetical protein